MSNRGYNLFNKVAGIALVIFIAVLLLTAKQQALAQEEQKNLKGQALVDKALVTFTGFVNDKNYTWLNDNLNKARGIMIFPQVLKAGFFWGGSGGTGVLLARNENGTWSEPAFYTISSMQVGFLAGAQAAEVILMIMKDKALDSLYTTSLKLGTGMASIAAGPVGAEAKSNITASMVTFSKAKGLYGGINLESSVLTVRAKMNKEYYGKEVSPVQIIVEKKAQSEGSAKLRAALKKAAQ
jgi:lipid-binding SYLF domain-containing protein